MTATRSRGEERFYKRYQKRPDTACQFCAIQKSSKQFVDQTKNFTIIKNIFSYSLWDGQKVEDHLMVIPKKHTDSLDSLSDTAAVEYVKILSQYEAKGYNVYARAPNSAIKSVVHQHTHLIQTSGRPHRLVFLLRKPYIRLVLK